MEEVKRRLHNSLGSHLLLFEIDNSAVISPSNPALFEVFSAIRKKVDQLVAADSRSVRMCIMALLYDCYCVCL